VNGIGGGTYVPAARMHLLLHTTEGGTIAGAEGAYRARGVPPHLTISYEERRVVQHVPFTRSAMALANLPGGVETNRQGVIQVELVGFARETHRWPEAKVRWIAQQLAPVVKAWGIDYRKYPTFHGEGAGWILAVVGAKQRFSFGDWLAFNGICGHQHAPENHHWDPGAFPIEVFVDELLRILAGVPTIRRGDRNEFVRWLRGLLGMRTTGRWGNWFGTTVQARVRQFQRAKGLKVDGIVGPQTWAALGVKV
jgi:hypothetical protein